MQPQENSKNNKKWVITNQHSGLIEKLVEPLLSDDGKRAIIKAIKSVKPRTRDPKEKAAALCGG